MKTKWIWLMIAMILLVGSGIFYIYQRASYSKNPASENFIKTLKSGDFKIEGIGLGEKAPKVLKKFGTPLRKTQTAEESFQNPDYMVYYDTWTYPGLTIVFMTSIEKNKPAPKMPDQVFTMIITSRKYATYRGIRTGDSSKKVLEKYGRTRKENNRYSYGLELISIEFIIAREKVSQIRFDSLFD